MSKEREAINRIKNYIILPETNGRIDFILDDDEAYETLDDPMMASKIRGIPEFELELKDCKNDFNRWLTEWFEYYRKKDVDQLFKAMEIFYPQYVSKLRIYLLLK